MPAAGAIPVPDSATVPLAPTVKVPVSAPVILGANATEIVHERPAAKVALHVLDGCVKLVVVVIVPTVIATVPELVRVTICVVLVVPTSCAAKVRLVGERPLTATFARVTAIV